MIALALMCCVALMNDWYDGPLSERSIALPERSAYVWSFEGLGADREGIRRLSARLEHAPIHVLAPDNPYAGYGLQSSRDGRVQLVLFNWLMADAIERAGVDRLDSAPGLVPPRHEALSWALAALRHLGVDPDVDWEEGFPEYSRTWAGQLAHDAVDAIPYSPAIVRLELDELGAPIPVDLAGVAPLDLPPYHPGDPEPQGKADIRALLVRYGRAVPPEFAADP